MWTKYQLFRFYDRIIFKTCTRQMDRDAVNEVATFLNSALGHRSTPRLIRFMNELLNIYHIFKFYTHLQEYLI